jgi:hypothetical protein
MGGFKMIRPFKIIFTDYGAKKNGPRYFINDHRGSKIGDKVKFKKQSFDKLLSYPITAFGYDTTSARLTTDINPKFDRYDVIRALDFWIEHWVYQNKCDYILEGTVNKDFELTVRELIETREAVLKLPADTQFTRNRIRLKEHEDFSYSNLDDGKYYHFKEKYRQVTTNMTDKQIQKAEEKEGHRFPKTELDNPNNMIEFTENVVDSGNSNSSISTLDPFCHKVVKMTYKEYINRGKKILDGLPTSASFMSDAVAQSFTHMAEAMRNMAPISTGMLTNHLVENFRDDGPRFDWLATGTGAGRRSSWRNFNNDPNTWTAVRGRNGQGWKVIDPNNITIAGGFGTSTQAQRYINEHILPSEIRPPPLQMGDLVIFDRETNQFRRFNDGVDPPAERIRLSTGTQSPEFLRWVLTGIFIIPENTHFAPGDSFNMRNDELDLVIANGTVAEEELNAGDIVTLVNGSWVKVREDFIISDVFFRTAEEQQQENDIHDAMRLLPFNPEARSITVQDDEENEIHYPDMHLNFLDNTGLFPGPTDWVTVPIRLNGLGQTEISTNLFMTDNTMLRDLESWGGKDVRITFENNDARIIINGGEYHFTGLNIQHDPVRSLSMIFRDLWIQEVNITAVIRSTMSFTFLNGSTPNALVRSNISLTIEFTEGSTNGALMRQSIDSDQARAWDLEILGNNRVRIGGDEYMVIEPINISFH